MFCSKCGKQNDDASTFCNQCGVNLSGFAGPPVQSQPYPMPGYGQAPPTPSRDQPPPAHGYGQPPPRPDYGQPPPMPNYAQPQTAHGYGRQPPAPGYGQHPQPQGKGKNKKKTAALIVGGAAVVIAAVVVVLILVLGGGSLSGTYITGPEGIEFTFTGSSFTVRSAFSDDLITGTFTLDNGRLVLTFDGLDGYEELLGYYDSSRDIVELHDFFGEFDALLLYKRGSSAERDPQVVAQNERIISIVRQANIVADQADARSVMMAGSVVGMKQTPPRAPEPGNDTATAIMSEFTGGVNVQPGQYTIYFDGAVAVGCALDAAHSRSGILVLVGLREGDFDVSNFTVVPVLINADGTATAGTPHIPR